MKKICIALLVLFCVTLSLSAQRRGGDNEFGEVKIVDSRGEVIGQFKEAHALVIGESDYINTGNWRVLPGVKLDVVAVKKLLEEQGFNVEVLENANSRNLRNGIINFLDKYGYIPDARIILYFAGHGDTLDLDGRKMGYIVPIDAPQSGNNSNYLQTVIPMTQFETWAKQYTSRHILFMFDSCFSGSIFRSQTEMPPAITRLINNQVRQFITSGGADEVVDDDSKFRKEFEHALRDGLADKDKDGYVTGTELGLYLHDQVSNYTGGEQNPRVEKIKDTDLNKGDFIFFVNKAQPDTTNTVVIRQNPEEKQTSSSFPTSSPSSVEQQTKEFFVGTWLADVNYNENYDTYRITLTSNGRCTVKLSNDNAEQEGTGNWSWDSKTKRLKVNVSFRNAKITYMRNIEWLSLVSFADDNNSFYILAKPMTAAPNVRFTFYRE
jgi:hypothetical protein